MDKVNKKDKKHTEENDSEEHKDERRVEKKELEDATKNDILNAFRS